MNAIPRSTASLLVLLLLGSPGALAQDAEIAAEETEAPGLYERMLEFTRRERMLLRDDARVMTEPDVAAFVAASDLPHVESATETEINDLLGGGTALCAREKLSYFSECPDVAGAAELLAKRKTRLRALGRDLQIIASSFEEPVFGTAFVPFSTRASAIARMWLADGADDDRDDAAPLRSMVAPEDESRAQSLETIAASLEALRREGDGELVENAAFNAAVWRYRFGGAKWLRGEMPHLPPPPEAVDDPELEPVDRRIPEIEEALVAIVASVLEGAKDLALKPGEAAVVAFPDEDLESLPENVRVWAYVEALSDGTLTGDAGLAFEHALEPAFPALCAGGDGDAPDEDDAVEPGAPEEAACEPVYGGVYAPAPDAEESTGLCNDPRMKAGYLCASVETDDLDECVETLEEGEGASLTRCTSSDEKRETDPGGDAGADGSWIRRDEPLEELCSVQIACGETDFAAKTAPKNADGVIVITMDERPQGSAVHLALHELVHAKQLCAAPPGSDPHLDAQGDPDEWTKVCCAMEADAYRVQCGAMTDDGVFDGSPYGAETCTHIFTDFSCRERRNARWPEYGDKGACPFSFTFDMTFDETKMLAEDAIGVAEEWVRDTNADAAPGERVAETCADIVDPPDGVARDVRIPAAIREIGRAGTDVCTPGTETPYLNSIGNTLLFINRCWLQSLRDHRLIPSRAPMVAGESAFAYDMCMRPDPGLGRILRAPQTLAWLPPPYRPAMLLQHLEEALCPGYPPGDPLCAFPLERRLDIPVTELLALGSDLLDQPEQFAEEGKIVRQFGEAVGARIGNRLYGRYVEQRVRLLTDVLAAAGEGLAEITKTSFPERMCSFNEAGPDSLLRSEACGLAAGASAASGGASSRSSGAASSMPSSFSNSSQMWASSPPGPNASSSPFDFPDLPIPFLP